MYKLGTLTEEGGWDHSWKEGTLVLELPSVLAVSVSGPYLSMQGFLLPNQSLTTTNTVSVPVFLLSKRN